jgi:hypothetical protein
MYEEYNNSNSSGTDGATFDAGGGSVKVSAARNQLTTFEWSGAL